MNISTTIMIVLTYKGLANHCMYTAVVIEDDAAKDSY